MSTEDGKYRERAKLRSTCTTHEKCMLRKKHTRRLGVGSAGNRVGPRPRWLMLRMLMMESKEGPTRLVAPTEQANSSAS